MKISALPVVSILLIFLPSAALSHPGKTDWHGGHKCVKDCEEWKLYYNEYHLHDKDGKPVRVSKKPRKRATASLVTAPALTAEPAEEQPLLTAQTVTVYRYVTVSPEPGPSINPLLLVLLVLLLFWLAVRLIRKREEA